MPYDDDDDLCCRDSDDWASSAAVLCCFYAMIGCLCTVNSIASSAPISAFWAVGAGVGGAITLGAGANEVKVYITEQQQKRLQHAISLQQVPQTNDMLTATLQQGSQANDGQGNITLQQFLQENAMGDIILQQGSQANDGQGNITLQQFLQENAMDDITLQQFLQDNYRSDITLQPVPQASGMNYPEDIPPSTDIPPSPSSLLDATSLNLSNRLGGGKSL